MPMSTRQIMRVAYLEGLVPPHLHGHTQHKTLGARLSEDILTYKQKSRFFRTRPGRFFLRALMKDRTLPIEYRTPIVARRRRRDLKRNHIACLSRETLGKIATAQGTNLLSPEQFRDVIQAGFIQYDHLNTMDFDRLVPIYAYVMLRRKGLILIHTKSPYAESRTPFLRKAMIGFPIPICHDDMTLFDIEDHGIVSAGLTAVAIDLDLEFSIDFPRFEQEAQLRTLVSIPERNGSLSLVGLVEVEAPEDFEPIGRRLAVGGLEWTGPQFSGYRLNDFDPWSQHLLREMRATRVQAP